MGGVPLAHGVPEMSRLMIAHDCWIVVCDGRKALFLRNEGNAAHPQLQVEAEMHDGDNPANRDQGSDRPGRMQSMATGPRSAMEAPDYHDRQEGAFLEKVSGALSRICAGRAVKSLIVVAAPRALAKLRRASSAPVRLLVTTEIAKDFTGHPVRDIERLLTAV